VQKQISDPAFAQNPAQFPESEERQESAEDNQAPAKEFISPSPQDFEESSCHTFAVEQSAYR